MGAYICIIYEEKMEFELGSMNCNKVWAEVRVSGALVLISPYLDPLL
jgi:hypothetical protein